MFSHPQLTSFFHSPEAECHWLVRIITWPSHFKKVIKRVVLQYYDIHGNKSELHPDKIRPLMVCMLDYSYIFALNSEVQSHLWLAKILLIIMTHRPIRMTRRSLSFTPQSSLYFNKFRTLMVDPRPPFNGCLSTFSLLQMFFPKFL